MKDVFNESFAGRSVFVTGHTGFKGSWLCLWLKKLGANVTGYSLDAPTDPNNFVVSRIEDVLVDHYNADIRDPDALGKALHKAQPDVILHLAAQSVVGTGYEMPRETFDTNVMGTIGILDAVATLEKPCSVVMVTSDKCYENVEQVWGYRENDAFGDLDPYGGSKGAAEIAIRCYRNSFFSPDKLDQHGIKLASARAGNVIGGGDWKLGAIMTDMVSGFSEGRELEIRSPNACRPWQHVLQALSGYLTLATRLLNSDDPAYCSGWNIGPAAGSERSVREVVKFFSNEWGGGSWRELESGNKMREAEILRLAIDKAIWQLEWTPMWGVEETFRRAVEWYRAYFDGSVDMQQLSFDQIQAYEDSMQDGICI